MITDSLHRLDFGPLDLIGYDHTGPFWFETWASGTSWGDPEQLVRVIETFLIDGAIAVVDGYGNREMTVEVCIKGEDSYGLALGEAALFAQVGIRNTLTWTPPNKITGAGTPCVFDVASSRLDHVFDDGTSELHLQRHYKLTVTALPWAHGDTPVSVSSEAPPGTSPVVTSVDACTATTGWSGAASGGWSGVSTSGGAIKGKATNPGPATAPYFMYLTKSGFAASMTATPYVRIDFSYAGDGRATPQTVSVDINDVRVSPAARNGNVSWYLCPTSTLDKVAIWTNASLAKNGYISLAINDISRTDMTTDAVGQRQRYFTLPVAGSARSPGSLSIADPTPAALGSVLVYTSPAGESVTQPPLRARRSSGSAETTDTSTVSGKYSDLATNHIFLIPAATVPAGGYALMARVKHASAGTYAIAWAGKSGMGATVLGGTQSGTRSVTLAAGVWTTVQVATLTLPTTAMGSEGAVRIELSGPSGLLLDEGWIFDLDHGQLTWVEAGTGTPAAGGPSNRLWLDGPSLATPVPSVWLGTAADRSDTFGGGSLMGSFGEHVCEPPLMNVYVVTSNSVAADVELTHFPSFHTHVVEAA